MKGLLFNLLEEAVTRAHGEGVWDAIVETAAVGGVYTSLGSYPDEEFDRLLSSTALALGLRRDAVVRWFGHAEVPLLAERFPRFFAGHASSRTFLATMNDVHLLEVRKLYPDAEVPAFDFEAREDGEMALGYLSPRKLCALVEGQIEGTADYFGESVTIDHRDCMQRGDPACLLICRFEALQEPGP